MAGHDATDFRFLLAEDWRIAREARLAALRDSPEWFLPSEPHESSWSDERWRSSCTTGVWAVAEAGGVIVGLARLTDAPDGPHVGSVWSHPRHRRRKIASTLVQLLVDEVPGSDVFVWVIQPNPAAQELYESLGFKRTDETQQIDGVGTEVRFRLERRAGP